MKSLVLIFLFSFVVNGVSGVETDENVESVSVIVGDSFTLHTDVTQIQIDDVIEWRFGKGLIGRIDSESNKTIVLVNDNEIFRDRVHLDDQTGDLKIRNIRITDFGLYKLEINGDGGISTKTFNISGVINAVSDGVKLVPVLERDSVILPSGLTEIQRDDQITWTFEGKLLAQINRTAEIFADVLDGRFVDRLQLIQQNGSLIITNVRHNTSGLYEVDITKSSSNYTTHKTFSVTSIDGGNKLSMMEGTSVTLESGVSKIHRDDVIIWRCEHGDSVIAKISYGIFKTFEGTDGRFKGTLELDYMTGSLTIRNIRTKHAGLYHLDMTGNHTVFKRFNLSVCSQDWSPCVIAVIGVAVLLLVVAVAIVVICCRKRVSRQTNIGTWRSLEHQLQCKIEMEAAEREDMLVHDITTFKGDSTISFRELVQTSTLQHAYLPFLSQSVPRNLDHVISPVLTEMVVQSSGTRRHVLKKVE